MDGDGVRVKSPSLLARQLIIPPTTFTRRSQSPPHPPLLSMRVSLFMPRLSFLLRCRPARTMVVNPSPVLEWNETERPALAKTTEEQGRCSCCWFVEVHRQTEVLVNFDLLPFAGDLEKVQHLIYV